MESEEDREDNEELWGALGMESRVDKRTIDNNMPTF
jgi:hypothetical protein